MLNKIILALPFGLAWTLFAENATDPLAGWGNLTALGIVAVVMVFIVTKMLPELHSKFVMQSEIFAKANEAIQAKHADILDRIHEREQEWELNRQKSIETLSRDITSLQVHCAGQIKKTADNP